MKTKRSANGVHRLFRNSRVRQSRIQLNTHTHTWRREPVPGGLGDLLPDLGVERTLAPLAVDEREVPHVPLPVCVYVCMCVCDVYLCRHARAHMQLRVWQLCVCVFGGVAPYGFPELVVVDAPHEPTLDPRGRQLLVNVWRRWKGSHE
jgi:hypothetical protein